MWWQRDSTFRVLLRGGPCRRSLKMWFQALEFSVSCTVAKLFFLLWKEKEERTQYVSWVPPARSTAEKKTWLQYKKSKFKRLEQHFQTSATRSAPREDTKSAVDLALTGVHQRAHIRSAKLARWKRSELEQKNEKSSGKKRLQTCFHCLCCRDFFLCLVGSATQV